MDLALALLLKLKGFRFWRALAPNGSDRNMLLIVIIKEVIGQS
jgi:hypothetical protein